MDIHNNQENASQLDVLSRGPLHAFGPRAGKTFQQSKSSSISSSKSLAGKTKSVVSSQPVSRPALGNINRNKLTTSLNGEQESVNKKQLSLNNKQANTKPSEKQSFRAKGSKTEATVKQSSDVRPRVPPMHEACEREFADNREIVDTFDDLWAVAERPSNFLSCLLNWRPSSLNPCIFNDSSISLGDPTYSESDLNISLNIEDEEEIPECQPVDEGSIVSMSEVPLDELIIGKDSL